MLEGAKWREDREYQRAAWMVAHLLLPYQKTGAAPLQPRDLLKPPSGDPEEELEAALAKQRELRERGELED